MTKCLKESTRRNYSFLCIRACVKREGGGGGVKPKISPYR